ncbi:MAG: hypothetical protein HY744_01790 [Deltaproteobacteria bacterium]|nr:hypothetical protein [Deltaproteobacteria bacterium]
MTYKRRALQALTKADLLELARQLELDAVARMTVDEVRGVVARSRRATLDKILPLLSRDGLKAVCAELGLATEGRERQPIVERILAPVQGKSEEEEAEPEPPAAPEVGAKVGAAGGQVQMWQSFRVRRSASQVEPLVFVAEFKYPEPGRYRVAARVTDVFGNDGIATVNVEVR